jgi:hypothetical protein
MVDSSGFALSASPRATVAGPIKCKCGQLGSGVWDALGKSLVPVEVTAGFYLRIEKKSGMRTEIACSACDRVARKV